MDADIELLKNYPNVDQVNEILVKILSTNKSPSLQVISALIQYTIPQILSSLPNEVRMNLVRVFQSLIGISNLVNIIAVAREHQNKDVLEIYWQFFQELFSDKLILELIQTNPSPLEIKEIDKFLFKGKIIAIVNEAVISNNLQVDVTALKSSTNYVFYLSNSLLTLYRTNYDLNNITMFMKSVLKFDTFNQFFNVFFNSENWQYFTSSFDLLKKFERRNLIKKFYIMYISRIYLSVKNTDEKLLGLYNILGFTCEYLDSSILDSIIVCGNRDLNRLVAMLITNNPELQLDSLVLQLLSNWSTEESVNNEPITFQESRTHMLLQILSRRKGSEFLKQLVKNKVFLDAITTRLSSFSDNVKALGVVVADHVCELNGDEKIFKFTEHVDNYSNLIEHVIKIEKLTYDEAWRAIKSPYVEEKEEITTASVSKLSLQQADSDDESDEEDPSIPPRIEIPSPIYIKDLMEYLNVDTKHDNAYEMRRKALLEGPTLLRRKSRNGNEVRLFSEDLFSTLLGLNNQFDDKDFENLKLNNLIAVIVTNPDVTFYVFKLLLTGDYSLQQRILILSATSLAARELRGLKDDVVTKSFQRIDFPSKMLPENLHNKYMELETSSSTKYIDNIQTELQDTLMKEASSKAQDEILGKGKLVRISAKLKKQPGKQVDSPIINDYFKIIASNFYFPLVNVWYEAGTIDIGHYSPIFIAHYIKTLMLLIHCAYPSSTQLRDMVKEFLILSCSIIRKLSLQQLPLVESIVTGVLLIFDILDEQDLISYHHDELVLIQNWLMISWESIIDGKIKSLCAGLLLRVSELFQKFERTIIDQTNSLY
ncbi:DNA replication checkpoint protein [Spathaspora sp. JA1]|nr:DNA replication checkpoint protein [Spathaspora sp. JA1]